MLQGAYRACSCSWPSSCSWHRIACTHTHTKEPTLLSFLRLMLPLPPPFLMLPLPLRSLSSPLPPPLLRRLTLPPPPPPLVMLGSLWSKMEVRGW